MSEGARNRTRLVGLGLSALFVVLAGKGGYLALSGQGEASATQRILVPSVMRADILDRNGEQLATSVTTYTLVAMPNLIWDPNETADALMSVFADMDRETLHKRLSNTSLQEVHIERDLTPRQRQAVWDLGLEGLDFLEESGRSYPRGTLAGHLLGFTSVDDIGIAGIEYAQDEYLSKGGEPLRLTLDNGVQAAVEAELAAAAAEHDVQGGAAILMDAGTGEIRALASWPPFNPNQAHSTRRDDPARLNRAVGAVYELGSVFKPLTVAAALEAGAVKPNDVFNVREGIEIRGFEIEDDHPLPVVNAGLEMIIAESSNIGTVHVNEKLGPRRQQAFLEQAGLTERAAIELAGSAAPILPEQYTDLSSATVSYGHGIAVSPLAFLSAFMAFANSGERLQPTLIMDEKRKAKPVRLMSAMTAEMVNVMMREAVVTGTGTRADIAGYGVAGKTGTAEKPVDGGYDAERNVTSFASIFPYDRPQYALIVVLDEPQSDVAGGETAAWNAAPTAGRIIERVAPLLGLPPRFESSPDRQSLRLGREQRSEL